MEERLPPAAIAANTNNDPPPPPPPPPAAPPHTTTTGAPNDERALQRLQSPSHHQRRKTYIIQIPKDQIYRVPPPENAEIMNQYRNPDPKKRGRCNRCVCWIFLVLVVVALIAGAMAAIYDLTLNPKAPNFAIKNLTIKYPKKSSNSHPTSYEILLEVENPNKVNCIGYEEGNVWILFKGNVLGKGEFPVLEQQGKGLDEVDMLLAVSTKCKLPKEIKQLSMKSSKSKKKQREISFSLKMSVRVKLKTWISTKSLDVSVMCDFVVTSLAEDADVKSQKCETVDS
ncbi:hypothetical protein Nepgr_026052 [Nepenthes gracilis]|uniref:Late embryogenesis abundant protein LEA-2 subgroup domain-containing protein n=1 Tax=Nepenthes gracilis TaxID=150966 RepID=A0AAD3Y1P8_NEPGR|nr:hypothetical protein Nepgr_026052 [Nepenthes gracilis]